MKFFYKVLLNLILCLILALLRVGTNLTGDDVPTNIESQTSCHSNGSCSELNSDCLNCNFNYSCIYGETVQTVCTVKENSKCNVSYFSNDKTLLFQFLISILKGDKQFPKSYHCSFCYQLPSESYNCSTINSCQFYTRYKAQCTVNETVLCLGNRKFSKFIKCEFMSGYKWSTALFLRYKNFF